jgi:hypothetical protein
MEGYVEPEDKMMRLVLALAALWICINLADLQAAESLSVPASPSKAESRAGDLVAQITKLLRAGTAPTVIVGFIQQWPQPYLTGTDDLLALREAGATEEILTAYSRRGAELRLKAALHARQRPDAGVNTNLPPMILYYPVESGRGALLPSANSPTPQYPFSDALWWWANAYPYPFDPYIPWGPIGRRSHPR